MIKMPKLSTEQIDAITYVSSVLGRVDSMSSDSLIWSHASTNPAFAAYFDLESNRLQVNAELPEDTYFKLAGYCAMGNSEVEFEEFWL